MSMQFDATYRSTIAADWITRLGASPRLRFLTGAREANCAATEAGTLISQWTLPSTPLTESGGVLTQSGTWAGTSAAAGLIGHARFTTSGGTCVGLCDVTKAFKLVTNASTAAALNVLHFASAAGVVAGMAVYGTGVQADTTVQSIAGADVYLDKPTVSGVANTTNIYFGVVSGEIWLDDTSPASVGQAMALTGWTMTAPGA